jgi:hypothetical protein
LFNAKDVKKMAPDAFNDDLWNEFAQPYIGLGQRGMEPINLRQCFIPSCGSDNPDGVHILEKEVSEEENIEKGYRKQWDKYKVHCDTCGGEFYFVFEKNFKIGEDEDIIMVQRVYATDLDGNSYGNIGWV